MPAAPSGTQRPSRGSSRAQHERDPPMTRKPLTAVRLADDMLERLDALVPVLAATPEGAAGNVSRSYVLRRALAIGLDALEEQYPSARKRRK